MPYINGQRVSATIHVDGLIVEEIWRNSSPGSNFAAKTLSGFDLTNAKAVRIYYANVKASAPQTYPPLIIERVFNKGLLHYAFIYNSVSYFSHRGVTVNFDAGTIKIDECQQESANPKTTANDKCIPLLIAVEK